MNSFPSPKLCWLSLFLFGPLSAWSAEPSPPPRDTAIKAADAQLLLQLADHDALVIVPAGGGAFFAAGGQVFDANKRQAVGKFDVKLKRSITKRVLSPDGKFFAYENVADYVSSIEVVDCATGQAAHTFRYTQDKFQAPVLLTCTTDNQLIALSRSGSATAVSIWNLADGSQVKQLTLPIFVNESQVAVDAAGKRLVAAGNDKLQIVNLTTGLVAGQLARPPSPSAASPIIFVRGLAFSPDRTEAAALIQDQPQAGFRIVVWNSAGAVIDDVSLGLQIGGAYNVGPAIVYTPRGDGWLVHGDYLVDRQLKAIAWIVRGPVMHQYQHAFLDADHLLASRGDFSHRELVSVKIPHDEIRSAVTSLKSDKEALLKPGDAVTLSIEVGETRFADKAGVTNSLYQLLTQRLTQGGLVIAPDAPTICRVKYSETAGEQLRVVERGVFGRDTGQKVQETVIALVAQMRRQGVDEPLWELTERKGNPHMLRGGEISDEAVRKQNFAMIQYLIQSMTIPYFVSADPSVPRLPLVTKL